MGAPRAFALIVIAAVALTGCTTARSGSASRDESARAQFDNETGQIIMPLSAYDLLDEPRDMELLNHAYRLRIRDCMEERGLPYTVASVSDEDRIVDDRQYGLWFEPIARVYGLGMPPSPSDEAKEADAQAYGEPWADAEQECSSIADQDPEVAEFMPTNEQLNDTLVPTIRTDAYRLAAADPEWQAARERWWECLRDKGLEPLTGATDWNSAQSAPVVNDEGVAEWTEQAITAAYTEAMCNLETGLAQSLADLEASYQAPMIEKNQSALNEWKTDKQTRLTAAADYVASHG